jgi:hypothetical protein
MFGCPYNLHPERPWLRRTIRGVIATGIVVTSPIIVVGAATAAITVLPPLGIYRLVKYVRSRRHAVQSHVNFDRQELPFDGELELFREQFLIDLLADNPNDELADLLQQGQELFNEIPIETFPLSIFADMDVENLFSDDDKPSSDFRTCPTTPAITMRKIYSKSLDNLTTIKHVTINRHLSIALEH